MTSNTHLARQLQQLKKHPVDGFSAGLVDESNLFEWEIIIIGPVDSLYEGAILKAKLSFPEVSLKCNSCKYSNNSLGIPSTAPKNDILDGFVASFK